jgi:hypothetical protein
MDKNILSKYTCTYEGFSRRRFFALKTVKNGAAKIIKFLI